MARKDMTRFITPPSNMRWKILTSTVVMLRRSSGVLKSTTRDSSSHTALVASRFWYGFCECSPDNTAPKLSTHSLAKLSAASLAASLLSSRGPVISESTSLSISVIVKERANSRSLSFCRAAPKLSLPSLNWEKKACKPYCGRNPIKPSSALHGKVQQTDPDTTLSLPLID